MRTFARAFFRQFKDVTVMLLLGCIAVNGIIEKIRRTDDFTDCFIILAILVLNGLFGAYQEYRVERILGDTSMERPTPLQKRLAEMGKILCIISVIFCVVIFVMGLLSGISFFNMLFVSLGLAVAAIPESLPAIVTIMLSVGICNMAKKGTLVRRLKSAEAPGQISCFFIDMERLSYEEKEMLRRAGIMVIDLQDRRTFYTLKERGEVIGVVGETEEDTELMKLADISCCMEESSGIYELSNIVFKDGAGIVDAVKTGRGIYNNLERILHFLLSCNFGEILTVFVSLLLGLGIPLLAIHLLMVNLITDCLPAIGLSLEACGDDVMNRGFAINKGIFTKRFIEKMIFEGIIIGGVTLGAFVFGTHTGGVKIGQTMAFCVLCLSQLLHSFNMTDGHYFDNPVLNVSLCVSIVLIVGVVMLPVFSEIFGFAVLSAALWFDVLLLSFIPFLIFEGMKR